MSDQAIVNLNQFVRMSTSVRGTTIFNANSNGCPIPQRFWPGNISNVWRGNGSELPQSIFHERDFSLNLGFFAQMLPIAPSAPSRNVMAQRFPSPVASRKDLNDRSSGVAPLLFGYIDEQVIIYCSTCNKHDAPVF
jgi:hypothetical protein